MFLFLVNVAIPEDKLCVRDVQSMYANYLKKSVAEYEEMIWKGEAKFCHHLNDAVTKEYCHSAVHGEGCKYAGECWKHRNGGEKRSQD